MNLVNVLEQSTSKTITINADEILFIKGSGDPLTAVIIFINGEKITVKHTHTEVIDMVSKSK
ncbi:flagellar FlbD family protein [Flavobacterium sp. AC]|uniref:Flagellar FlbD family protein n=1 Tax=Flavobacterium azizsancarii TaxID=2961580 RepID=A0ABT4W924_9FLAO|nr:flagellar FlbD family protein [Flavobacterium azizsancarii]MDA6069048.1 flagellar FlbD family protein [Flavobacterium azizsancarii]